MAGPKAPRDPKARKRGFYIMRQKQVAGNVQPDGKGIQYIYLNDVRLITFAKIVGNIENKEILELLKSADGFRSLVSDIGVTVEMRERDQTVNFIFQMYGKTDPNHSGTLICVPIPADGMEHIIRLKDYEWTKEDAVPGQIRFEFPRAGMLASVDVKLYVHDEFTVPEPEELHPVNEAASEYREMIHSSLLQTGNCCRLKRAIEKAKRGEEVTLAFIGGSITQGAGAVPIHTSCYAYRTWKGFCSRFVLQAQEDKEKIHFIKAGVGGTPSELGMVRFERDILRQGAVKPDIVVVEFAVNDEGDETGGECYESLVRRILALENQPAVILLFAVFADDWNLQERLIPVGKVCGLPMVSLKNAVTKQFYREQDHGRVISKSQYFYDSYHPSNMGHQIMADCLLHLMEQVDCLDWQEDFDWENSTPVYGDAFQAIRLRDRHSNADLGIVECGSFKDTDTSLQAVEMDDCFTPVKEFPYNWMHRKGTVPFRFRLICKALVMVYKDSGEMTAGKAQVLVDGKPVLTADPHINGWIHCNPIIVLREQESREHVVEISMAEGEENKEFTILGFGVVE